MSQLLTVWKLATSLFERVYTEHPGSEPEAFAAANEAIAPLVPALREEMGIAALRTKVGDERE